MSATMRMLSRGLFVGAVGAVVWSRYAADRSRDASGGTRTDAIASAPPIWTPMGMQVRARELATEIAQKQTPRVGVTEAELMGIGAAPSASVAKAPEPPLRAHVYQADAATLARLLADHVREPRGTTWGLVQETRMRELFANSGDVHPAVTIDCGAKTCLARLQFDNRADREAYLQGDALPLPAPCRAVTALPNTTRDGPHQVQVIYLCRS